MRSICRLLSFLVANFGWAFEKYFIGLGIKTGKLCAKQII